jgi:hypothetical protein
MPLITVAGVERIRGTTPRNHFGKRGVVEHNLHLYRREALPRSAVPDAFPWLFTDGESNAVAHRRQAMEAG